jgi:AcrR family transcriptional regulator
MAPKARRALLPNEGVLPLHPLVTGIPSPPPASLDPILDAAARCFARHGVTRTSVQDVAQELRVNRTTVYRQVGNVETLARLLLARELHRLLEIAPTVLQEFRGPEAIIGLMTLVAEFAREHPVAVKLINDEPEVIGPFLVTDMSDLVGRVSVAVVPLLRAAMDAGEIAQRDPAVLADWLVRSTISVILAPPAGGVRGFLSELLIPALRP